MGKRFVGTSFRRRYLAGLCLTAFFLVHVGGGALHELYHAFVTQPHHHHKTQLLKGSSHHHSHRNLHEHSHPHSDEATPEPISLAFDTTLSSLLPKEIPDQGWDESCAFLSYLRSATSSPVALISHVVEPLIERVFAVQSLSFVSRYTDIRLYFLQGPRAPPAHS